MDTEAIQSELIDIVTDLADSVTALEDMLALLLSHLRGSSEPKVQQLQDGLENLRDQGVLQTSAQFRYLAGRLVEALDPAAPLPLLSVQKPVQTEPDQEELRGHLRLVRDE